jgi:NAD(P)-dependent dehydrogenase (short-subunit alcohol dehydrogenase family)
MGDCADLKDRCAIVTGGASGMGLVHAATFLAQGARVAVTDNRQSALDEARERLGSTGRLLTMLADNRETAQIRRAVAAVEADFGSVDILVNNAGISGKRMPLEDIDEAAFDEMFAIHVRGAFFFIKAVVAGMKRRRDGRLINISSHFAMIGSAGASHYTSAKIALHGLTRACALELAPWDHREHGLSGAGRNTIDAREPRAGRDRAAGDAVSAGPRVPNLARGMELTGLDQLWVADITPAFAGAGSMSISPRSSPIWRSSSMRSAARSSAGRWRPTCARSWRSPRSRWRSKRERRRRAASSTTATVASNMRAATMSRCWAATTSSQA